VVPRWRTFREALANNELNSDGVTKGTKLFEDQFLREKEVEWQCNKAVPFALDLVGAATMLGKTDLSVKAAEFILESTADVSETGKEVARVFLGLKDEKPSMVPQSRIQIVEAVKELKGKRIQQARNAFVWVDLAHLYTLLGQNTQARQALRIALNLAPTNRFVLRCTARFLHHINEYDEALDLLRKNGRTPEDPWLLAAEVAASGAAEKSPRFAKLGSEVLTRGARQPISFQRTG